MIESVFYFQVLFFAVLSVFAVDKRSWPFFVAAAVFGFSTAIMLADGGVTYFSPVWDVNAFGDNTLVAQQPLVLDVASSAPVSFWYWGLIVFSLVWLVAGVLLALRPAALGSILNRGRR
jgi:hypothetical protein